MQGPLLIIQIWPHLMIEVPRETVNCVYQESQGFRRLSQEKKKWIKGEQNNWPPKGPDLQSSKHYCFAMQCEKIASRFSPCCPLPPPPPPTQITRVQTKQ